MSDIVPFKKPKPPKKERDRSVKARWGEKLASAGFSPVPSVFLRHYHKLRVCPGKRARKLNSTEVMVIIHLAEFKWDERDPWPSVGTIAERLGISPRSTREAMKTLEEADLLKRKLSLRGGTSSYSFKGLIAKLEALLDEELANKEKQEDQEEENPAKPRTKKAGNR